MAGPRCGAHFRQIWTRCVIPTERPRPLHRRQQGRPQTKARSAMSLWKRGKQYWIDGRREPPSIPRAARHGRRARSQKPREDADCRILDPAARSARRRQTFGSLTIKKRSTPMRRTTRAGVAAHGEVPGKRTAGASPRSSAVRLEHLTIDHVAAYQNQRTDEGRAPKTINGELSVLRQLLRHARLWYRFEEDYRALKNTKPPVGQALTDEEQERLFAVARSATGWLFAYVATALSFYCGLRACEIKGLQWKHVDFERARIQIRRSKTPAGWRDPSLNDACARGPSRSLVDGATAGLHRARPFPVPVAGPQPQDWTRRGRWRRGGRPGDRSGTRPASTRSLPRRPAHGAHAALRDRDNPTG